MQGVVAYSICSHWHQHFLAFDLWPFVCSVGVGGSEREKTDIGSCRILSQQPRASGSGWAGWAGWASAHPIFWDYNKQVNPFSTTGTAFHVLLATQIVVASIGPETNMMYLAWNSVVEHICFVPLTEMYFLCCTQQLASIKGQLISPFGVIVWTKIPTKVFKDFCPSLLKEVEQKKMKRLYFF